MTVFSVNEPNDVANVSFMYSPSTGGLGVSSPPPEISASPSLTLNDLTSHVEDCASEHVWRRASLTLLPMNSSGILADTSTKSNDVPFMPSVEYGMETQFAVVGSPA